MSHGQPRFPRTGPLLPCSAVLNTLRDVSQHCDYHKSVDFQCQHCMIHYKSKATIAAHMNVKGAHLRAPFDPDSYFAAMPSPAPASVSAAPQSIQCSPPPMVATLSEASIEQLLRDIDSPATSGTDDLATSVLSLANAQAAPPQPQSTSSLDMSPSLGHIPQPQLRTRQRSTGIYDSRMSSKNSCCGGAYTT